MNVDCPFGLQNLTDKLLTEAQNSNEIRLNCELYWEGIVGLRAMYMGFIHGKTMIYLRHVH